MGERIVGDRYRLRKRIGAGSFGEIYCAENIKTHRLAAVKLESTRAEIPQLSYESRIYTNLAGGTGIPRLHWYGTEGFQNIMVIDLLGKSLEDLLEIHRKLSLKTVLMVADQMLACVEFIHKKNYIHRDIKPDNFVMGLGKSVSQLFVIDFGLAKRYRDKMTHEHIKYIEGKSLTGTARYASVGALSGCEQSRRDDLESLGYVWLYLLRGNLPWMGINIRNQKAKYAKICEVKKNTSFEDLCAGFPDEFVKYFYEVRKLGFTETPKYGEYRQMFRDLFIRQGYVYDYVYDWTTPKKTDEPAPVKRMVVLREGSREVQRSTIAAVRSQPNLLVECGTSPIATPPPPMTPDKKEPAPASPEKIESPKKQNSGLQRSASARRRSRGDAKFEAKGISLGAAKNSRMTSSQIQFKKMTLTEKLASPLSKQHRSKDQIQTRSPRRKSSDERKVEIQPVEEGKPKLVRRERAKIDRENVEPRRFIRTKVVNRRKSFGGPGIPF